MYKSYSSTRFIIFDKRAKIIAEHQTEFEQILPHAGWHEHDPDALVEAMNECITKAVEKLEWMGWSRNSVKGIGMYSNFFLCRRFGINNEKVSPINERLLYAGHVLLASLCVMPLFGMMRGPLMWFVRWRRSSTRRA